MKECYFYLDSTPTHSYMKALYKYPQAEFPYARLVEENRRRGKQDPEFELADTGVFDENRYFDVFAEYAKADPDDILIRITVANRGPRGGDAAPAADALVPQHLDLGLRHEGCWIKPSMQALGDSMVQAEHVTFGTHVFVAGPGPDGAPPALLFTENETNTRKLFGSGHLDAVCQGCLPRVSWSTAARDAVNPGRIGTKVAAPLPAGDPGRKAS